MKKAFSGLLFLSACFSISCRNNGRVNVRAEADEIHEDIRAEKFGKIYEDASPRIKECYSSDTFSEKMGLLIGNLKAVDSQLNFRELKDDTEKIDLISSSSDLFAEGVYAIGAEGNERREYLVFKNEDNKLRLFAYRILDASVKDQDVRTNMIACSQKD